MRRKLKEDLGHIEVELAIIKTLVTDLYDETIQRKHSSLNQIRAEFGLGPLRSDPVEKAAEAIKILQEYCNSQDTCYNSVVYIFNSSALFGKHRVAKLYYTSYCHLGFLLIHRVGIYIYKKLIVSFCIIICYGVQKL